MKITIAGVFDAKTGERKYQQRLGGNAAAFTSSPEADGAQWLWRIAPPARQRPTSCGYCT
jgi:hypothetical protein